MSLLAFELFTVHAVRIKCQGNAIWNHSVCRLNVVKLILFSWELLAYLESIKSVVTRITGLQMQIASVFRITSTNAENTVLFSPYRFNIRLINTTANNFSDLLRHFRNACDFYLWWERQSKTVIGYVAYIFQPLSVRITVAYQVDILQSLHSKCHQEICNFIILLYYGNPLNL